MTGSTRVRRAAAHLAAWVTLLLTVACGAGEFGAPPEPAIAPEEPTTPAGANSDPSERLLAETYFQLVPALSRVACDGDAACLANDPPIASPAFRECVTSTEPNDPELRSYLLCMVDSLETALRCAEGQHGPDLRRCIDDDATRNTECYGGHRQAGETMDRCGEWG